MTPSIEFCPSRLALWFALATLLVPQLLCNPSAAAEAKASPDVKSIVEFTRIVEHFGSNARTLQEQISPDRKKAFVLTRQGEVASDKNRFDILLLDLDRSRLQAGRPNPPRLLLSVDSSADQDFIDPSIRDAVWIDDKTIAFLARMKDRPFQAYSLNVSTQRLTQLTRSDRTVVSFAVSRDLRRVVHLDRVANPFFPPGSRAGVVGNNAMYQVLFGQHIEDFQLRKYQYFSSDTRTGSNPKAHGESFVLSAAPPNITLDPAGRWVLLKFPETDPERERRWVQTYPAIAETFKRHNPSERDPLKYFSRADSAVVTRLRAYDLASGKGRDVLDAPMDALAGSYMRRQDLVWLNRRASVVIAGAHLPAKPDTPTIENKGSHVIEYWPHSGQWKVITQIKGGFALEGAYAAQDGTDGFAVLDDGKTRHFRFDGSNQWLEDGEPKAKGAADPGWSLSIDEALNEPPDFAAVGPAGQRVRLTRLNPQFNSQTWGIARPYSWKDRSGRQWDGGLVTPNDANAAATAQPVRMPLVIQTYGFVPDKFYLDGPNPHVGYTSGFAGRAFVRENIMVLAIPWKASGWAPTIQGSAGERESVAAFMEAVRGAVDALVGQGLVDPNRIGIIGFSATGLRVHRLLTFGDVEMRAASLIDGDGSSLFSFVSTYGHSLSYWRMLESLAGGMPFGDSVDRFVKNDASLNSHCIRAAVRIEGYGLFVHTHWDTYALLRAQYKPAEMIIFPHGRHSLSRPSERMISLQGNVDWYRFWLKGEERDEIDIPGETQTSLRDQYKRWRQMADLKTADEKKPRCPKVAAFE